MAGQVYTKEKGKEAHNLYYSKNVPVTEIAKQFKVSNRVIYNWLNKVDDIIKEEKRKTTLKNSSSNSGKLSKMEIVKNWLKNNSQGTYSQFIKDIKASVHRTYFNLVKSEKKKVYSRKPKNVEKKASGSNGHADLQKISTIQSLLDESEFLKWWSEGERKGYVEKLLLKINEFVTPK